MHLLFLIPVNKRSIFCGFGWLAGFVFFIYLLLFFLDLFHRHPPSHSNFQLAVAPAKTQRELKTFSICLEHPKNLERGHQERQMYSEPRDAFLPWLFCIPWQASVLLLHPCSRKFLDALWPHSASLIEVDDAVTDVGGKGITQSMQRTPLGCFICSAKM